MTEFDLMISGQLYNAEVHQLQAMRRRAAELCGAEPGECVLFDDSPVYCGAAKQAGWQVFGVADPIFADRAEEMAAICGPGRFPFSFTGELPLLSR